MFLLVHYDDFEDIRELIDYESLPITEPDAEDSADESIEDEPQDDERQFVAVKISPQSLRRVPHGIITSKRWRALTFHLQVSTLCRRQLPFSSIVDELTESVLAEVIKVIDLNNDCWATYDDHWDCYCKTEDVCGCGCDPLHDGW
jgi:hypothetical protein